MKLLKKINNNQDCDYCFFFRHCDEDEMEETLNGKLCRYFAREDGVLDTTALNKIQKSKGN